MHRTGLAIAVASVVFIGIQIASAADHDLPEQWRTEAPLVGDRGIYDVVHVGNGSAPMDQLHFERLADRVAHRPDGTPFAASVMHESWSNDAYWFQESLDDGAGGGAVRWKWDDSVAQRESNRLGAVNAPTYNPPEEAVQQIRTTHGSALGLCGLRHGLADGDDWFGGCGGPMKPIRTVAWGNRTALIFDRADAPGTEQVWMVRHLPVPVQVLVATDGGHDVYRLAAFGRGHAPSPPAGDGTTIALEPPEAAADGQPNTDNVPVPFPLSEALAQIQAHWLAGDVAVFANQPDTIVRAAQLTNYADADYIVREWRIAFNDGRTGWTVTMAREDHVTGNEFFFDWTDPAWALEQGYKFHDEGQTERIGPGRAQLPSHLPSVEAAHNAWMDVTGWDAAHPVTFGYGFAHECADPTCATVDSWIRAGTSFLYTPVSRYGSYQTGLIEQGSRYTVTSEQVRLGADGTFVSFDELQQTVTHRNEGATGLLNSDSAPSAPATSPNWTPPTGPETAAAAGLAVLAGVLAWLSRAGPLGALFSRIAAPDLTKHPVRAQLLQVIDAQPGIHLADLSCQLERPKGVLQHHLRKLTDAGLLRSTRGHATSYFLPGQVDRRIARAAPLLRGGGTRAVLEAVLAGADATKAVVAATGLSQSTVSYHVKRLQAAGLVNAERAGRTTRLSATELGQRAAAA